MCIASYDTACSDCLKWGANMCLCPPQDFTMNYTYTVYLSIVCWPPTMQQLIDTSFLHVIYCSERLDYFCILKSCWTWGCASDGLRSSATNGCLFLNYICLSISLSYAWLVVMSSVYSIIWIERWVTTLRTLCVSVRITSISSSIVAGHHSYRFLLSAWCCAWFINLMYDLLLTTVSNIHFLS